MSDDTPVRLDALDPTRRTKRFDGLVAGITRRAGPLLAARRTRRTAFGEIALMRRPLLAAAAAIVLVAGTSLFAMRQSAAAPDGGIAGANTSTDIAFLFEDDSVLTLDDMIEQAHEETR